MKNRIPALITVPLLIGAMCTTALASAQAVQRETAPEKTGPIATDGVFQAIGAFLIVEAFFNPRTTTVTRAARAEPTVSLMPTAGTNGYGLAAIAHF